MPNADSSRAQVSDSSALDGKGVAASFIVCSFA
jgi:hypothetical protein